MVNDRPYGSLAGTPLDYDEDDYDDEYDYEGDYDDADYEYNEIEDGGDDGVEGREEGERDDEEEYGTYYDYDYEESCTLETVYKVPICPRRNLLYKQIYLITDQKLLYSLALQGYIGALKWLLYK